MMIYGENKNFISFILIIIFCNLFFGNAFHNLGFFGLPLNEIILLFSLIKIGFFKSFKNLVKHNQLNIFFIYIFFGALYILYNSLINGIWAIRDGLFIIDSLYLLIGYSIFNTFDEIKKLKKFFKKIVVFSILYIFIFLIKSKIEFISPVITTYSGNTTSLFFNFFSIKFTFIFSAFISFFLKDNSNKFKSLLLLFFLIFAAFIFFQSRMTYLSVIFCFLYIYIINEIKLRDVIFGITLVTLILLLISFFQVEIKGRFGLFNIKFFYQHFLTLFSPFFDIGIDTSEFKGQLGSVSDRLGWWKSVIYSSTNDIKSFFIGSGFGKPLINFYSSSLNIPAREPHNSFLTIIGRIGFFGLFIWCIFHYKIYLNILNLIKENYNDKDIISVVLIINCYLIIIIVSSFGDSMLQFPCFAIPFYFFSGILFKIHYLKFNNSIIKG